MLILDLWGISFHAVVVFGLGRVISFKSVLGRCDSLGAVHKRCWILAVFDTPLPHEYSSVFYGWPHTVKSRAVDQSTIQIWKLKYLWHYDSIKFSHGFVKTRILRLMIVVDKSTNKWTYK